MKIAIQILLLVIYTAPGLQAQKVTVSYEDTPLNSVLSDLCIKTRISYIADAECLNFTYPVTLKNSLPLDELLKEIFSHQPVDYRIIKNCIIVTPKNIVGKVIDQNGEPVSGVIVERKHAKPY